MVGITGWNVKLTGRGPAEVVSGRAVHGDFFGTMGLEAAIGRGFTVEETPDHIAVSQHHDLTTTLGGGSILPDRAPDRRVSTAQAQQVTSKGASQVRWVSLLMRRNEVLVEQILVLRMAREVTNDEGAYRNDRQLVGAGVLEHGPGERPSHTATAQRRGDFRVFQDDSRADNVIP
jgi:hypothetical protein